MTTAERRQGRLPENPVPAAAFTPETAASIARARQHSLGDLLRRTALRYPGKLAIIAGQRRVRFAEFDVAVNRCANALAAEGVRKGDRIALLSHNCWQYVVLVFATARLGAVLVPVNFLPGPDPATLLATIEREQASKLFCPPTVWISLLRHPDFDARDLSSLRKGYYGAAPMPVEVLRELSRRLPAMQTWNFYGQTEMSPLATILQPHEQLPHAGSAGRASLNVETRVVDDFDEQVAPGEVGEIVHRSPHAALGYFNDEDKTAESFRNGWFHSGDLGRVDENGYLSVVDRKKDMIKTGGENVSSREVEEALYALDGVAEVAVFGITHPHWIEAVTAVIVPKEGVALTEDQVNAHARTVLAGYKRPKYVIFADALPKNPSGKILKKDLRATHANLAQES